MTRTDILHCAERAGFGGVLRASLSPRLIRFAELILDSERQRLSGLCNDLGDAFQSLQTDFADGQMDGAYQCAEVIKNVKP
jgi:hypothetical protein